MNPFHILDPFFQALNDGKLIRFVVATMLRCFAGLTALGGVAWSIVIAGAAFSSSNAGTAIGSLLMGAIWLVSAFFQTGVLLYRARTISELGDGQFTVTAIISVFCRLIGEELFIFFSLLGVGGCLFAWFADSDPLRPLGLFSSFLPKVGSGSGFVGGLLFAVTLTVIAFFSIMVAYAIAELTAVLVDIARTMNDIRLAVVGGSQPRAAFATAAGAGLDGTASTTLRPVHCRACSRPLEYGAGFCGACGLGVRR